MSLKPQILIIDDDAHQVNYLTKILESQYDPIYEADEWVARETYTRQSQTIRIVFLNLNSFEGQGLTILKDLKKESLLPEFIVYSSQKNIQWTVQAIKEGAYDYLVSPLDEHVVYQTIEKALDDIDIMNKYEKFTQTKYLKSLDKIKIDLTSTQKTSISSEEHLHIYDPPDSEPNPIRDPISELLVKHRRDYQENRQQVLIVEDDPDTRNNIEKLLEHKYDIFTSKNTKGALEIIEQNKDIAVILLDVYLESEIGLHILGNLKKSVPNTQVIIMTAFQEEFVVVEALKLGAADYINKPFSRDSLIKIIEENIEKKLLNGLKKELITKVPKEKKIELIKELIALRAKSDLGLRMGDIYAFFPDLQKIDMPEEVQLPRSLYDTIELFIEGLRNSIEETEGDTQSTMTIAKR